MRQLWAVEASLHCTEVFREGMYVLRTRGSSSESPWYFLFQLEQLEKTGKECKCLFFAAGTLIYLLRIQQTPPPITLNHADAACSVRCVRALHERALYQI